MQPTTMPVIDLTLIGKHLEVCVQCDSLDNEEENWNHQKMVHRCGHQSFQWQEFEKTRSHYKAGEAAEIEFDEILERKEESYKQVYELKSSKWNPKKEHHAGCWRMDVSIFRRNN